MKKTSNLGFSTKCIHSGEEGKYKYDIMPPIHLSSTFIWREQRQKYLYTRVNNPTREILEEKMAALEKGKRALAFSSGMAAISTVLLSILRPGDSLIVSEDLYGGSRKFLKNILYQYGIKYKYVDTRDLDKVRKALDRDTKVVFIETPTNPLMRITDIKGLSEITHKEGLKLIIDNTFASPYVQNPLELGADIVIHSATKYLSGHSDVIAGVAIFINEEDYERALLYRTRLGGALSPFDSYLLIRSIKTLAIRMERHCKNALKIAEYLEDHKKVKEVLYPYLQSFAQYDLAKRQMRCGGGMLSFRLYKDDQRTVDRFLNSFRFIKKAVSLGGVESLIEHPLTMTHAGLEGIEEIGITRDLIRFSVGIEDVSDLINELECALSEI